MPLTRWSRPTRPASAARTSGRSRWFSRRARSALGHVGVGHDPPVGGDQRHPRVGGAGGPAGEGGQVLGGLAAGQVRPRLVVEEPPGRGQPRLQRLDGEPVQRLPEVEAGHQGADRHEPDQRQRELDGDPAADEAQEATQHPAHHSAFRRRGITGQLFTPNGGS